MDLYDFFNTFITAVAADGDSAAWAHTNFGREIKVYADLDFDAAPESEADAPYIIFHSPGKRADQQTATIEYIIGAWLVVNRSGAASRGELNLAQPSALELILDFITLIQNAVVAALPAHTYVGFDVDTDTLGMVPEAHGYMDINIKQIILVGQDPLGLT